MYRRKDQQQAEFESLHLSFGGRLRSDNRWVKLSKIVPWEQIEQRYAVQLNQDQGAPALSVSNGDKVPEISGIAVPRS